jgi:predicted metal-dependent peptidase
VIKVEQDTEEATKRIAPILTELASRSQSTSGITGLGGEPLVFSLIKTLATKFSTTVPIAGTDGETLLLNPDWVIQASPLTIYLTFFHEALHSQLMHPQRRGNRKPSVWNIAVDYVVMGFIFDWLRTKFGAKKAISTFKEAFGNFITLEQLHRRKNNEPYTDDWIAEPFNLAESMKTEGLTGTLTDDEVSALRKRHQDFKFVFADPDLPPQSPTKLYDTLIPLIQNDDTFDTHLDCKVSEKEINRRIKSALYNATQEHKIIYPFDKELLSNFLDPTIDWKDDLRLTIAKLRETSNKTWTTFRKRPMELGLLIPANAKDGIHFAACLDTSISLDRNRLISLVSELQGLDERGEGILVCCDEEPHWNKAISLQLANLNSIEVVGRRGTQLHRFINEYQHHLGEQDLLIVMTDGLLEEKDLNAMNADIPVHWLVIGDAKFDPKFGKVHRLGA